MDRSAAAPRQDEGGAFVPPAVAVSAAVNARGTITAWSPGSTHLLGHTAEEAIGRRAAELLAEPEETAAEVADVAATARRCLAERSGWSGELALRHRDGGVLRMTVRALPAVDAAGAWQWLLTAAPDDAHAQLVEWAFDDSPLLLAVYGLDGRILRMNAATRRVLHLADEPVVGRFLEEVYPEAEQAVTAVKTAVTAMETGEPSPVVFSSVVRGVGESGVPVLYEMSDATPGHPPESAWAVNLSPVRDRAGRVRAVFTAGFNITKQYLARQRLALLNEASNRIGTTLDVTWTAQELADMVVPRLADFVTVDLLAPVLEGGEPSPFPPTGLQPLRRAAHQSVVAGIPEAVVAPGEVDLYPDYAPAIRSLASGEPLLIGLGDPGFARWLSEDPLRKERFRTYGFHSVIAVPLRARGTTLGVAVLLRHRPEPFVQDDLVLATELAARAAVCVDNARRYTRERSTALALQRSLLPQQLYGQAAVDAASRYLPAGIQAGIGGDWFDVIPLSGTRVALVVGDVVGHGIHASATMGRLRTAVRTLADVDLQPDELLTHLDDLVAAFTDHHDAFAPAAESAAEPTGASAAASASVGVSVGASPAAGEIGATCLYAIYDPVSRRCLLASAGHPLPAIVAPDGSVTFVKASVGPPLGVGGLPFEATEVELAEGSLIALYTDGLVESRDRDFDEGLGILRTELARSAPSLEETCDQVMRALLPERPMDDAALLIARTRALDSEHVATWTLDADPALVSSARKTVSDQLTAWGLEEAGFVTELVVSELVTNAIRYARPPISLRLIRGESSLICEVSDASSTAPHMRRARAFDEGGRGLLLVAQLTQHWGTRQTATGKTIWAEQDLTPDAGTLFAGVADAEW
ncbi:SpoIIE family protein phosphatase [Streptomyces sp. NPDC052236]|uniref:ATP-binding SpoIIE family protein phosphatase n=1 Tax=Streptomyces sp. NPDC052236 TaxID=3365686 RepID=UPI0037D0A3EF